MWKLRNKHIASIFQDMLFFIIKCSFRDALLENSCQLKIGLFIITYYVLGRTRCSLTSYSLGPYLVSWKYNVVLYLWNCIGEESGGNLGWVSGQIYRGFSWEFWVCSPQYRNRWTTIKEAPTVHYLVFTHFRFTIMRNLKFSRLPSSSSLFSSHSFLYLE
jgi:hypothetical protein